MSKPLCPLSEALLPFSAVVLTGGSSGIGKSFIKLCGKLRADLIVCNLSRRVPPREFGSLILRHFPCDLANVGEVAATAAAVAEYLGRELPEGRILLINNSGFGAYGHFPEPNLAHQLEMLEVNVRAPVQLTGLLLPLLRSRGGAIVNVASTAAFQPTPYLATYGASKTFVLHWTLALNEELRGTDVRAMAVCPGPTATDFFRRAGLKQGSVPDSLSLSADDVARQTLRALGQRRSLVVTGWKNRVLVALSGIAPKPLAARIARGVLARYRLSKARA